MDLKDDVAIVRAAIEALHSELFGELGFEPTASKQEALAALDRIEAALPTYSVDLVRLRVTHVAPGEMESIEIPLTVHTIEHVLTCDSCGHEERDANDGEKCRQCINGHMR